jgi:hypothetical protein
MRFGAEGLRYAAGAQALDRRLRLCLFRCADAVKRSCNPR